MAMTKTGRVCAKCGATVFPDAPQGFCSVCLFRTGLGLLEENEVDLATGRVRPTGGTERVDRRAAPMLEFGDYELLEEIGRGGQGVVYRARQKSLNRTVALKVIGLGHWASTPHLKRFRHEAEAAASLEHPQIVPIYEIGERDGSCYFSMKYVQGGQLDEVVKREPMSIRRAAELLVKIARTVQFAHEHGILHRDIKPGNILLDRHGEPHLTDFGLARLIEQESTVTNSFEVLGTPSYMAPEQAAGNTKELTAAADIYALGAIFYQMLTGQPPFAGGTTYETIRLVMETEPRNPRLWNPKVDIDLATICSKCLEKDPKKRYETAEALAQDVERWLRHEPIRARRAGVITRSRKWVQRNPVLAAVTPLAIALAAVLGVMFWRNAAEQPPPASIAVLPFENLSEDKDGASFADGVQDDILTKLAKIADLKVISRTSVMSYRGARNIQQIGRALNVSHVLEGSVRRNAGRIHLNTQLIDTRTDTHVWAEEYERDLTDMFAVQSEVAQKIAEQLHAKVSSAEKSAIARAPTADIAAFDLYTRAKNLFLAATNSNSGKEDLLEAADLLNQALARDPSYFEAYCQLGGIHDLLYILGHDHSPRRLGLAEAAIDTALRLRPNAGEAHLARAANLYSGYLNYDEALTELELARKSLPNDCRIFELVGLIDNRRGKFGEALIELEHAMELDPRNVYRLEQIAQTYLFLRRYPEAGAAYDRALAIDPNNVQVRMYRADLDLAWKADTHAMHQVIDRLRDNNPRAIHQIADSWVGCALADRDPTAAKAALIAAGENMPLNEHAVHFSRSFVEGWIARLEKNELKARTAFESARAEQEKIVQAQPGYAPPLCVLGAIDAALGRKQEALGECRRAVELLPVEKDAFNGPLMIEWFAVGAGWVGEKDLALEELATALRYPSSLSYGNLKLFPFWDPLRGDPRFEKIVADLAPK
jgi:TolB-like protein/Tfp pilus assembly protein PilF/predicted Ser/Thr protein kinase